MSKILIVDDEVGIRELLSEILRDEGHDVLLAENAGAARKIRNELCPDLVLLDIWMPDSDGISLLKEWSANGQLKMPVIMMSGHGTIDSAVEATRIGALDFLEKPIALQKLLAAVKRGLAHRAMPATPRHPTLAALTRSLALRDLRRRLNQLTEGSRSLLLKVGPGSLAELAARSVPSASGAWFDLSASLDPLDGERLGAVNGGTVFVPELSRLNRHQRVNLGFLFDRLERYNLHLVVATEGSREDFLSEGWDLGLVDRLFDTTLPLPGLPEIKDDIPELAGLILQQLIESGEVPMRRFSSGVLNMLRTHTWPGGYPELRATVKSLAMASLDQEIGTDDASALLSETQSADNGNPLSLDLPLREAREEFERLYFRHHLRLEGGNMTRLAEKTGVERTHLYRKLKQLGLHGNRKSED
ncbi:MAG: sigma-54-dependent Fis family transcriptional regulator [Rhodocyclaceae bacterium]|nr:sigma-54-dependent Fis family transcriptional regulator [Rhodocyclaceae bacterium]